jgi:hypothetical protein
MEMGRVRRRGFLFRGYPVNASSYGNQLFRNMGKGPRSEYREVVLQTTSRWIFTTSGLSENTSEGQFFRLRGNFDTEKGKDRKECFRIK